MQAICDRLGPGTIGVFFERWMARAAAAADRRTTAGAGYWWELSMRQIEVSRTLVFDAPRNGRAFFEALVADNLDHGPPRPGRTHLRLGNCGATNARRLQTYKTGLVTRGVRCHHQRRLQAFPRQAVLQGRSGAARSRP